MPSGVFAQNKIVRRHANRLRRHDLVAERITDHAVLMNSSFVCEGVATNNRLIGLHCATNDRRKQLAGGIELLSLDGRIKRQVISSYLHLYHDFFERCFPAAFAYKS